MLNERRADELKRMTKNELIAHIAELEGTMNGILLDWSNNQVDNEQFVNRMFSHVKKVEECLGPNGRN